jgi:hypothetical protein
MNDRGMELFLLTHLAYNNPQKNLTLFFLGTIINGDYCEC